MEARPSTRILPEQRKAVVPEQPGTSDRATVPVMPELPANDDRSSLPRLSVDSLAEAVYLRVAARSVSRTVAVHPQVNLDLDSDDHIVGVEIFN